MVLDSSPRSANAMFVVPYSASVVVAVFGSTPCAAARSIRAAQSIAASRVAKDADFEVRPLVAGSIHRTRARKGAARLGRSSMSTDNETPSGSVSSSAITRPRRGQHAD